MSTNSLAPATPDVEKKRSFKFPTAYTILALLIVWSVIPWSDLGLTVIPTAGWWFAELAALFLVAGIVIGIIGRLGEEGLANTFVDGARDLLGVALIVGLARGVSVDARMEGR